MIVTIIFEQGSFNFEANKCDNKSSMWTTSFTLRTLIWIKTTNLHMMPRISQPMYTMYIVILTNYCRKMLDSFLDLINVVSLYYTLTLMPWQNSSSFTMNSLCVSNHFVCTCTSHGSFHSMPISSHATQPIFQTCIISNAI